MSDAPAQSAAESNKFVRTAFEIMKLALTSGMPAIDAVLVRTYDESGTRGLLLVTKALATTAMIVRPDLRDIMPSLGPSLLAAADPRPVLDGVFSFYGPDGQPRPFDDEDLPALVQGLLFLHACACDGLLAYEQFQKAVLQGRAGVGELIGGVLMVLMSVLRSLPEDRLRDLLKFQVGSSPAPADVPADAGVDAGIDAEVFDLPAALKTKLLAAARLPDDQQSARQATMLIAPLLLLHGEPGLMAVCQTFAAAIADVLGVTPNLSDADRRRIIPMFVDDNDEPMEIDGAVLSDPMMYVQVIAYRFLAAYLSRDRPAQLRLMRCDDDNGALLCNGLSAVYRTQHALAAGRHREEN